MTTRDLRISEEAYRRLEEQAARLQLTPEQVIEHLLASDVPASIMADDSLDTPVPMANSAEALAAVRRLTTLFAGVEIRDLEETLSDPFLLLVNADSADLDP